VNPDSDLAKQQSLLVRVRPNQLMLAGKKGTDLGTGLTPGQACDPDSSEPAMMDTLNCDLPTRLSTNQRTHSAYKKVSRGDQPMSPNCLHKSRTPLFAPAHGERSSVIMSSTQVLQGSSGSLKLLLGFGRELGHSQHRKTFVCVVFVPYSDACRAIFAGLCNRQKSAIDAPLCAVWLSSGPSPHQAALIVRPV